VTFKRSSDFDAKETAELPHAFPISVRIRQFFDTPVKAFQGIGKFIASQKILTKDLFIESLWFKAPQPTEMSNRPMAAPAL
jgi:hypothetical protein